MKKYRIVKLESVNYCVYYIEKRFLFFWWHELDEFGNYSSWINPTDCYNTLEEARAAVNKFQVKKTIIEEL